MNLDAPCARPAAPPLRLLNQWGLAPKRARPDVELVGSPERSVDRWAVEDERGGVWILERLHPGQAPRRERIGRLLAELSTTFPFLAPYQHTKAGCFTARAEEADWQLAPWLEHEPLPRPEYLEDREAGASLGRGLADLARAGWNPAVPLDIPDDGFDLRAYVHALLATLDGRRPELVGRFRAVEKTLSPLWRAWPKLPLALCHGDCHPLNALWRGGQVLALVDWEFCGLRPRFYDLANCLGCVGIEEPEALGRGFALGMVEAFRPHLTGPDAGLLPELLLALRFAWLSEWLRRRDEEMIELERDYMELLAANLSALSQVWKLPDKEAGSYPRALPTS